MSEIRRGCIGALIFFGLICELDDYGLLRPEFHHNPTVALLGSMLGFFFANAWFGARP